MFLLPRRRGQIQHTTVEVFTSVQTVLRSIIDDANNLVIVESELMVFSGVSRIGYPHLYKLIVRQGTSEIFRIKQTIVGTS